MAKLQACEPTHVVTEQKYEQGKRGGADVGSKAEKCHFMPSDRLTARSLGRAPEGGQSGCCWSPSDLWAADGSGGGRRQVLLSPLISIRRRRASRRPIPSETSYTFVPPSFLMMVH